MEGMNGLELAQNLRKKGDRVSILFVTGCENYALDGYSVQPVHFLLKPVKREVLAGALRTDWELNHKPKAVVLRDNGKSVRLLLSEIVYMESFNHNILVHLQSGETRSFSISLSLMERQLPSGQFCRCHNSYLVNLDEVEEIGRTEISLRDGSSVPMGRTYYKSFQSSFVRYMNG